MGAAIGLGDALLLVWAMPRQRCGLCAKHPGDDSSSPCRIAPATCPATWGGGLLGSLRPAPRRTQRPGPVVLCGRGSSAGRSKARAMEERCPLRSVPAPGEISAVRKVIKANLGKGLTSSGGREESSLRILLQMCRVTLEVLLQSVEGKALGHTTVFREGFELCAVDRRGASPR